MKKIYVSVPMRGRTNEDIQASIDKIVSITEAILEDKVEVVNPFNPKTSKDKPIEALGKSIAKMQKADLLVSVYDAWEYNGCEIESHVANAYHIRTIRLDLEFVCPDIIRMRREAVPCNSVPHTPVCNTTNS